MSENHQYGDNVIDAGYQMNGDAEMFEGQNPSIPPLNVNVVPSGNNGYSAPVSGYQNNNQMPVTNQGIMYNPQAQQSVMSTMSRMTGNTMQQSVIQ